MKYQAKQLVSGKWAVMAGNKKYFTDTVGTESFARQQAAILSAQWYQKQIDLCFKMIEQQSTSDCGKYIQLLNKEGNPCGTCELGDFLC